MTTISDLPIQGRREERTLLESRVDVVRDGLSVALVIVGEAGIGKTRLLGYVAEMADGAQIARAEGLEAEAHLAFAALHRLLGSFLHRRDALPAPQRTALETAFGLVAGPPPDLFLVGLAALTLLGEVAGDRPLICLVDDAHWLDRESRTAIAFIGRRLDADAIGLFISTRDDPGALATLQGLTTHRLEGLADEDARELIATGVRGRIDSQVANVIVDACGGNPLALLEISGNLTDGQLARGAVLPEPLPIGERLELYFAGQIAQMPPDTQCLLLLITLTPVDDQALLWRAADRLGVAPAALDAATGIFSPGPGFTVRHPLIRSAIYGAATPAQRRAAHAALGRSIDIRQDPDGRAWHLAESVVGVDESVAGELERAADRARDRGGFAAQAAFLSRAADLTADPQVRASRLLAAARPYLITGDILSAAKKLDQAAPGLTQPQLLGDVERLRARVEWFTEGSVKRVSQILMHALDTIGPLDARRTRDMLYIALATGIHAGRHAEGVTLAEIAAAALKLPPSPEQNRADVFLDALARQIAGEFADAVPWLRAAVEVQRTDDLRTIDQNLPGVGYCLTLDLWDDESLAIVCIRADTFYRAQGALTALKSHLHTMAIWTMLTGHFAEAQGYHDESQEIGDAIGLRTGAEHRIGVLAWQGRDEETQAAFEVIHRVWVDYLGYATMENHAAYAMVILKLGRGRYTEALAHGRPAFEADVPGEGNRMLSDLVEAAVRADDRAFAEQVLDRLTSWATASATPWALGVLARSQALLADDPEPLYQQALDHLDHTTIGTEQARTRLLFGEWLRRTGRRTDARTQLRDAHHRFTTMGATAFADRARTELAASGESARRRSLPSEATLTPREFQVAGLVSAGATNAEVATRLFVTASTVEFHLNKIFRKLDITSRRQLGQVMGSLDAR